MLQYYKLETMVLYTGPMRQVLEEIHKITYKNALYNLSHLFYSVGSGVASSSPPDTTSINSYAQQVMSP
jgi:hypothetical protein